MPKVDDVVKVMKRFKPNQKKTGKFQQGTDGSTSARFNKFRRYPVPERSLN
jgi:hypothetical protein